MLVKLSGSFCRPCSTLAHVCLFCKNVLEVGKKFGADFSFGVILLITGRSDLPSFEKFFSQLSSWFIASQLTSEILGVHSNIPFSSFVGIKV